MLTLVLASIGTVTVVCWSVDLAIAALNGPEQHTTAASRQLQVLQHCVRKNGLGFMYSPDKPVEPGSIRELYLDSLQAQLDNLDFEAEECFNAIVARMALKPEPQHLQPSPKGLYLIHSNN